MLPNTKNNSDQVKRMLYSKKKVKAKSDGTNVDGADSEATTTAKRLRDLEEIFAHHSQPESTFEGNVLLPSMTDAMRMSGKNYIYPFVSAATTATTTTGKSNNMVQTKKTKAKYDVNVCIFRVFDCGDNLCDPFLQFKLRRYSSKDLGSNLRFPYIQQTAAAAAAAGGIESVYKSVADQSIKEWFPESETNTTNSNNTNMEYKCVRTDPETGEIYVIYEETGTTNTKTQYDYNTESGPISINAEWWWVCVHEIVNRNKILSLDIHATVVDLFEHVPSAMFLYDSATGYIMETPHVLYSGITEGTSLDEMVALGPRKLIDNTFFKGESGDADQAGNASGAADRVGVNERRMYGSQYYLYEYESVFRSACYRYVYEKNRYVKRSDPPHIFRHAVFLGTTSTTIFDTDNTTTNASISDVQNYVNTSWCSTNGYKSAHHGKYELSAKKREGGLHLQLDPVFCVCNNERIVQLGYYKIDAESIPVKFDSSDSAVASNYEIL